jgi:hypothetical protein
LQRLTQEVVAASEIWQAVYRLVDDAPIDGVLAHELGPLAAARRRATGEPVPEALAAEERAASFAALSAIALLRRIREIGAGPLVLLKGPEVAAHYPPNGRRFGDIDILTLDGPGLYRALREHGFLEVDKPFDFREHHHLTPLRWPVVPLSVEVHVSPNWPRNMGGPPVAEILEAAVPSVVGVEGISAPRKLHHALLLAAHAWSHEPLQTLRELLDVAVLAADESLVELQSVAAAWGLGRVWHTTRRAIDSLFYGAPPPAALRIWARHLRDVRERTVIESHLQAVLHPFWGRPPGPAMRESLATVRTDLLPGPEESWEVKLRRVPLAVRDAGMPRSRRHGDE